MNNTSALMDLLFGQTRQAVLAVLLLQPEASFHLRELARETGSHAGTLGRELEKLVGAGLLLRRQQGNQVHYQANRACPLFDELASMFRKTHGVAASLGEALAPLQQRIASAFLFGSMASGTATEHSDIDLLVVGDLGLAELLQALHPLQLSLRREINPALFGRAEFATRIRRGDAFLAGILQGPKVFVKGTADDLAELAGHPQAASPRT